MERAQTGAEEDKDRTEVKEEVSNRGSVEERRKDEEGREEIKCAFLSGAVSKCACVCLNTNVQK